MSQIVRLPAPQTLSFSLKIGREKDVCWSWDKQDSSNYIPICYLLVFLNNLKNFLLIFCTKYIENLSRLFFRISMRCVSMRSLPAQMRFTISRVITGLNSLRSLSKRWRWKNKNGGERRNRRWVLYNLYL